MDPKYQLTIKIHNSRYVHKLDRYDEDPNKSWEINRVVDNFEDREGKG